jgi:hypothetical protein
MGKSCFFDSRITLYFTLLIGLFLINPVVSLAVDSVCARVKIEIKQELTLERQAFDAHLRVNNGLSHITLENARVDVTFTDAEGNPVPASSDPDNTDALFFIRLDSLENIEDVNGNGTVLPSTTADIHWLIIPSPGSSNGIESGTLYYVGARLSYIIGGQEKVTEVTPDYIFVKPMPEITLDYFLPIDVFGDDAFTPEIELPVPFSIGLRVNNSGHGTARNLKIDSAQPKIVENEQGLLMGFNIEGSQVNGKSSVDSLLVDMGDIHPDGAGTARWNMTCALSGKFVEFTAGFSHSDELGGELTSLISDARTHFLVHDVLVDLPGRDPVRDFLAKDADLYRVYESDSVNTEVTDQSDSSTLQITGNTGALTTALIPGFMVVKLNDPFGGEKEIKDVIRSDGKIIKTENVWMSKSRNEDNSWRHFINLFDVDTTGTYTIKFTEAADLPFPPVLQFIENRIGLEGLQVSIMAEAADPNGTTPVLSAVPLPAGGDFTDLGNGSGTFNWTPAIGQAGTYEIIFKASDGFLTDTQRVVLTIHSIYDSDGDDLLDAWEMQYFGSLDRDGTGDFDQDGISDLEEFLYGSDPTIEEHAPTTPVIISPQTETQVNILQPELVIENSIDEDGDALSYEFEVFADPALTIKVGGADNVVQGVTTTSWSVPEILNDNSRYHWRTRATDGYSFSLWAYGIFFVNTSNNAPGPFYISSPGDDKQVDTRTPVLQVTNAMDADEDEITYTFEVYSDNTLSNLVASESDISQGPDGITNWMVNSALTDDIWYFWRAVVTDEHGASTETAVGSFFVNTADLVPDAPQPASPAVNSNVAIRQLDLVVTNSTDAGTLSYYFELDKADRFDSPAKLTSGEITEGADTTAWHVSGLADNTWYFWRVKTSNGSAESGWVQSAFFVNTANEAPPSATLKNPGKRAWVGTSTPSLELNPCIDPDADNLFYKFEIYGDEALTTLIDQGVSATAQWMIPSELTDKTRYFWRAQAEDAHGLAGSWMDTASFFVKHAGPVAPPAEITVKVSTSLGSELSGLRIYAFTELGSYTGKSAVTDGTGTALFDPTDFSDGSYKFRVDYLGHHFWSDMILLPGIYRADVVIRAETAEVIVNIGPGSLPGVKVYLFSASGAYLGLYQKTDETGRVTFQLPTGVSFKFRADILGGKYWSDDTTLTTGGATTVDLAAGGGIFQVTLQEKPDVPMAGIKVYLFNQNGSYLGLNQVSDPMGRVAFAVPEGTYKVRGDFLGYQFWSPETHVTIDTNIDFTIAHQDVIATLDSATPEIFEPLAGIKIYLFTPSGSYLGKNLVTDENGQTRFHLPRQPYKIRADFLGQQYWSDVFTWTDPTITIPMADVELILGGGGIPVQDQVVYVFSASGAYLGIRQTTDSDGKVFFRLPQGEYKFRADYQGSRYWSDATWVTADQLNVTTISTGGGSFAVSVLEANAKPLAGVKCYVFSASHTYLGIYGATDGNGQVFFDLADGDFKFRVDYLGSQFWSDEAAVPEVLSTDMVIAHETVEVTVTTGAGAVEGVKVYLFSANGTYLGRYQETDTAGIVSFDLPVGNNYQFRADILGSRHWSDVLEVSGGVTNFVEIDAGGGLLQMTVQKDENLPMPGLKVYLFDAAGTYLGRSATTDAFGQVEFRVPGEVYTLRVDYLGYQFWSAEIVVAENTVMEMPIIHRQVEIIAQGSFQGMSVPIGGIKVYLFSPTDTYLGQHQITGSDGQVAFSLPDQSFRVRVDYLGHPFWSEDFRSQDSTVTINRGLIEIHARRSGVDVAGARVYLFHEKGSYLGWNETTNPSGKAAFMLPDHAFKFRIDENGEQHWTPLIQVHAGEENVVEVDMDQ